MAIVQKQPVVRIGQRPHPMQSHGMADLMDALGFDPLANDSALVAVVNDIHFGTLTSTSMLDSRLLAALQSLTGKLARIVINGDILTDYIVAFGASPWVPSGDVEGGWAAAAVNTLEAIAPVRITTGNHDTYHGESPIGAFLASKITQYATQGIFHAETLAGTRLIYLSTTHGGDLPPEQIEFLSGEIGGLSVGEEAITFIHQPALAFTTTEAGPAKAFRAAIEADPGGTNGLWVVCGHSHTGGDNKFQHLGRRVLQWTISTGAPTSQASANSPDNTKPSAGFLLLKAGKVFARIGIDFKDNQYRVVREPDWSSGVVQIPKRLDGLGSIIPLASYIEGEYDRSSYGFNTPGSLTWRDIGCALAYASLVSCRFPAELGATTFFLLAHLGTNPPPNEPKFEFSNDGVSWTGAPIAVGSLGINTATIPLPLRAGPFIYIRITDPTGPGIGGWGFY